MLRAASHLRIILQSSERFFTALVPRYRLLVIERAVSFDGSRGFLLNSFGVAVGCVSFVAAR